nr:deleted in malignant brain tumors 1 protein-like [Lytechinus pictus]
MYSGKSFHLSVLSSSLLLALILSRARGTSTINISLTAGVVTSLKSSNYPDKYENNLHTRWHVHAPSSQRILVTFNDFYTQLEDILFIKEEKNPYRSKYTGKRVESPFPPFLSLSNHIEIIFNSDYEENNKGFNLSLSATIQTEISTSSQNEAGNERSKESEHIRVLNQIVCRDKWHAGVADTICREAGFPGSYETSWGDSTTILNGTSFTCNEKTHRLRDCNSSISQCSKTSNSVIVTCNGECVQRLLLANS